MKWTFAQQLPIGKGLLGSALALTLAWGLSTWSAAAASYGDASPAAKKPASVAGEKPPTESQLAESSTAKGAELPKGSMVLQIGDSFAGALGPSLSELLKGAGLRSMLRHKDASYLTDWAYHRMVSDPVEHFQPDLVLLTLGANELRIPDPAMRIKAIRKIVEQVGGRPCVWVASPLWKGESPALLETIRENSAPCVYLDTNALYDVANMPRTRDGIHPSPEARVEWARFVFQWLKEHRVEGASRPLEMAP